MKVIDQKQLLQNKLSEAIDKALEEYLNEVNVSFNPQEDVLAMPKTLKMEMNLDEFIDSNQLSLSYELTIAELKLEKDEIN